jgi:thiamine-monophosphate kinase
VTGTLGDSAAGLKVILENGGMFEEEKILRERHYRPVPRIDEGVILAATPGVNAMMDISDGIASDLRHIMEESSVGARVDVRSLPLSAELRAVCARRGWDPAELAAGGGEDYELLFTCRPGTAVPVPHTVIGEILAAPGVPTREHGRVKDVPGAAQGNPAIIWEGTDRDFTGFRHF